MIVKHQSTNTTKAVDHTTDEASIRSDERFLLIEESGDRYTINLNKQNGNLTSIYIHRIEEENCRLNIGPPSNSPVATHPYFMVSIDSDGRKADTMALVRKLLAEAEKLI